MDHVGRARSAAQPAAPRRHALARLVAERGGAWYALLLLAAVPLINAVVDPWGVIGLVDLPRLNHEKTERLTDHWLEVKSLALRRGTYDTIVLGSSRAQVGIDPAYGPLGARRTYNLGLPGAGMPEEYALFRYAVTQQDVRMLVWDLDFSSFNPRHALRPGFDRTLAGGRSPAAAYAEYLCSPRMLARSWITFKDNVRGRRSRYPPNGFQIRGASGRAAHHRAWLRIILQGALTSPQEFAAFEYRPEPLALLERVLRYCRVEDVDVYLFVAPMHACQVEALAAAGLYETWETWKRDLTAMVARVHEAVPGDAALELWDFCDYHPVTTEPFPPAEQPDAQMQRYWESSHFRQQVGNLVLDRMLGSGASVPAGFGVRLTPKNIEAHLAATRVRRAAYVQSRPEELTILERIATETADARRAAAALPREPFPDLPPLPAPAAASSESGARHRSASHWRRSQTASTLGR